ncbi:MAG: asparagine--tRNA ligase, partial [Clostridia bacterium]|nr:asparagine--tRNA ligase [Clostridia bacterium]
MFLKDIYSSKEDLIGSQVHLCGWIRNHRKQKNMGFIDFFDGTCFNSIQLVYNDSLADFNEIQSMHIGASINVEGSLIVSAVNSSNIEIEVGIISLIGDCPENYPLQPKRHSLEFL